MPKDSTREAATAMPAEEEIPLNEASPPRRMALAGLIVGASAFLVGFVPVLGLVVGVAAIILGSLALAKRQTKWMSISGIALGAIGALTSLLMTVALASGDFVRDSQAGRVESVATSVEVPDLTGTRADKAVRKLEGLALETEFLVPESAATSVDKLKDWKVASSDPAPGASTEPGSTVTLTLVPRIDKEEAEPSKKPKPSTKNDAKATGPPEKEKAPAAPKPPPSTPASEVEVLDMSYEGNRFVSATFPVADTFTKAGVMRNLKEGCVEAIQAAKDATPDWYDFDTVQCMGMMDGTLLVGSANFSGALLSEISDVAMQDDPEGFWAAADRSNIAPAFQ